MAERRANRLQNEASPYLLQHALNPVDWWPWCDEALETARREDKPIFLSIGYSACHWCHVMERECFENEAIAQQMNAGFVCIKVDREERPDLDHIYQMVVQILGRSGGWPLTVFLTPTQRPFFGGTYFPPVDKYGVPSLPRLMTSVLDAFRATRGEIDAQADEVTHAIASVTEHETRARDGAGDHALGPGLLAHAAKKLALRFDDTNGGFGSRPKFPSTMALALLLRHGMLDGDDASLGRARFALDRMRAGGVYDQLGGGFHRYSTDAEWLVPHFEKMLYDNALLLRLYVDAWRATREERFAQTAREIAIYVAREMTSADGAFFATQDADSEGEEGKFFVWTPDEIREALHGDEEASRVAIAHFGVTNEGNFEESGASVLHEARPISDLAARLVKAPSAIEETLVRARAKLFAARERRPKPFRDEKILASWNALAIGALADAGAALGDRAMVARAERAFAFVERVLLEERAGALRVKRLAKDGVAKGGGFLDDTAFVADAALDLFEATGDARYVTCATRLAATIHARFWDASAQVFFFTPDDAEALIHRVKDLFDHATPSATSIACKVMLRLGAVVDPRLAERATAQLEHVAPAAAENPFGFGESVAALDRLVRGSVDLVIAGAKSDPVARAMGDVVFRTYLPNRNLVWLADAESRAACAAIAEGKTANADGSPRAFVCRGRTCSAPLSTAEELAAELGRRAGP